jgi:hypothetical protein
MPRARQSKKEITSSLRVLLPVLALFLVQEQEPGLLPLALQQELLPFFLLWMSKPRMTLLQPAERLLSVFSLILPLEKVVLVDVPKGTSRLGRKSMLSPA